MRSVTGKILPLLVLLLSIAGSGCREDTEPSNATDSHTSRNVQPAAEGPAPATGLRGAVLIVLDTVRADRLSCYGYHRDTAPALSELAEAGILFENVVAYSPWTLPSMLNLFSASSVDSSVFEGRLKKTLVSDIRQAGYTTGAVTEGGFVSRHFGFDLGFDTYTEEEGAVQLKGQGVSRQGNPSGGIENTFRLAREWISRHGDEPFFLFIHTYEPHAPYTRRTFARGFQSDSVGDVFQLEMLPEIQSGSLKLTQQDLDYIGALYDGGIHSADHHVGRFLDFLEQQGLREETLVVVTSDHGEELGDHYVNYTGDHGHSLHDDLLLVPLIVHAPGRNDPVRRVPHQVRLMDVMPTIADLLGVPVLTRTRGSSLVPYMDGSAKQGRVAAGGSVKVGPERKYVRLFDYKIIRTVGPHVKGYPLRPAPEKMRLYDIRNDPDERVNLARENPQILARLNDLLGELSASGFEFGDGFTVPESTDEQLRQRLQSLGYLQ